MRTAGPGRLRIVRGKNVATVVGETERKYDLDAGGLAALDAVQAMTGTAGVAAASRQGEQLLDAVLLRHRGSAADWAGVTLRRCTGGEDAGWNLKLPAGEETRDEVRLPLAAPAGMRAAGTAPGMAGKQAAAPHAGDDGAVPEELAFFIRAYTRGAALAPVMHTRTSRRVVRLLDGAGQTLAEIAADHVSAEPADADGSAALWDEIEAKLVTGGPALLTAIDTQLRRAGARPAAAGTKLRRALAGRLPPSGPRTNRR